jgi:hypothetical protein
MNIILAGIMGRYPYGGVAWCSLMYLLGLRRLGHEVWYLEDTGECNYDAEEDTIATDPRYALKFIRQSLQPYALGDRWCYIDYTGKYHGKSKEDWLEICRNADLFLNLSGGSWFWRDEYTAIPHTAFIDSDPGFTQLAISRANGWYVDFFRRFGALFTFGRNIGTDASPVPVSGWNWQHTWQPVITEEWHAEDPEPPRPELTTVMSWVIGSFTDIGGNKDAEFRRILELPSRVRRPLEVALSTRPPQALLRAHGWACRDALPVSHDLNSYRNYIHGSFGEFSVAKNTYVAARTGWFSDRTECYLASGRPAVVQDTGFSAHLPTGRGLFAYRTIDEAVEAIEAVGVDWATHSAAARQIAREHFDSDIVLPSLIERATGARRDGSALRTKVTAAVDVAGDWRADSCGLRR